MMEKLGDGPLRDVGEGANGASHLITLAASDWAVWRCAFARGAGFAAALALDLAAPEAAAAADGVMAGEAGLAQAREDAFAALRTARTECAADAAPLLAKAQKAVARRQLPSDTGTSADVAIQRLRDAIAAAEAAVRRYPEDFARSREAACRSAQRAALDPRVREAVTWQNRAALDRGFASFLKADPGALRSQDRNNEELVASYLFRYSTKNDTIGFFGPVGFARLVDGSERVTVRPGRELLCRRETFFEQWGIDVLAGILSTNEAVLPWLAPHRFGFLRLEGATVKSPLTGKQQLSKAEELVLRACDGKTPARQLAAELSATHGAELPNESAVLAVLKDLVAKKLAAWSLEFRTTFRPEVELRARLEAIGDASLRAECLRPLDELEAARAQVAASAGDAPRLAAALAALDGTFERLTGAQASRNAGAMYAARGLVFEDGRRDLEYRIGATLVDEVGPALALVLASARYLTHEAGRAYDAAFRELYATMRARAGASRVPFSDFWFRAQRLFHGTQDRPIDPIATMISEKWGRILGVTPDQRRVELRSADIAQAVADSFAAPHAGWSSARQHSPDLMIGASSVEAIERGEYFVVLGEIHVARNTLDYQSVVAQHPAPGELSTAIDRDVPEPRVFAVVSKDSPRSSTVRGTRAMHTTHDYELETGFDTSALPPERALPLGELELEEDSDGALFVVGSSRSVRIPLLELMGSSTLGEVVVNELALLPDMPHSPRITIDRLVVHRETWRFAPKELAFAQAASEAERFLGARRWARSLGMPRFAFALSSLEVKPMYVDFDSPVAINILSKIVRRGQEDVSGDATMQFSEMLPDLEDSWLPDASGNRYTSEVRVVTVDQAPPPPHRRA